MDLMLHSVLQTVRLNHISNLWAKIHISKSGKAGCRNFKLFHLKILTMAPYETRRKNSDREKTHQSLYLKNQSHKDDMASSVWF